MTNWAFYATMSFFIISSIAHLRHSLTEGCEKASSSTCCQGWKWCTSIFHLAFCSEILVTVFFWCALYPVLEIPLTYTWKFMHGGPLLFLIIDFALN